MVHRASLPACSTSILDQSVGPVGPRAIKHLFQINCGIQTLGRILAFTLLPIHITIIPCIDGRCSDFDKTWLAFRLV